MTDVMNADFWIMAVLKSMTGAEWRTIILAFLLTWLVTEFVKRSVIWKNHRGRPLVTYLSLGSFELKLRIPHLVAFISGLTICWISWPDEGLIWGVDILIVGSIVGGFAPPLYSGARAMLVWALRRIKADKLADQIEGNRRSVNSGPPEGLQERRQ